jgi:hypothetical protein
MALTLDAVQAILSRASYRHGECWRFEADRVGSEMRVRLHATVSDARRPGEMVDLGVDSWPPADALTDEPALVQWLLGRMIEHEVHEAREWLRLDGQQVDDPHGPNG